MPRRKTKEEFISDAISVHGDRYDYSLTKYVNARTKVDIICKIHKLFYQNPNHHLQGRGCKKCSDDSYRKTIKKFISDAINVRGDRYDYSLVKYINDRSKIKIICKKHGVFLQTSSDHLTGKGCPNCGVDSRSKKRRKTKEEFISDAISVHGIKYNYSLTNYINSKLKIQIICKKHGEFDQKPNSHLQGQGCPKCTSRISKPETKWLYYNNIPSEYHQHPIKIPERKRPFITDGYDPITNTIYEFYGDYWHGNPKKYNPNDINSSNKKSFGQLYEKTLAREMLLKEAGYNIITIWENDWNKFIKENKLKSAP